jgi:hypothetical protein
VTPQQIERLLAEAVPTGTFDGHRTRQRRRTTKKQAAAHRAALIAAIRNRTKEKDR